MIELPDNVGEKRLEQPAIDSLIAQHQVFVERGDKGKLLELVNIDLRDIDLGDKPLSRAVFVRCNLAEYTFRGNAMQNCTFSGCNLEGVTFDHVELADTEFREQSILDKAVFLVDRLRNVTFQQVKLDRAVFRIKQSGPDSVVQFHHCEAAHADLKGCSLSYARFEAVNFRQCEFSGAILEHANFLKRRGFDDCRFNGAWLQHATFEHVDLLHCFLCGANLSRSKLEHMDLSRSDFTGVRWNQAFIDIATVDEAIFAAPVEILGRFSATLSRIAGAEKAKYGRWFDRCSWALVRKVGAIPLFGISYLAILAIMLWAGAIEWYNHQVQALKNSEAAFESAWVEQLHLLPAPSDLGYMLIAILILAAGATVYRFRCPDIIKEHTVTEWQYVHAHEVMIYHLHSYSRFWWRWISGVCYAVGGTWVSWHVAVRVWRALRFLFSQ